MKGNFFSWARRLMACVVCGVMAVSMFAVPAYRGWQTKTLPDGSQITVRQMGDEFFHYWETEDGKQAFEQADGTFVVTGEAVPTKAQARAKRAASTLQSSKPRKAIGERNLAPRGLLVLVQFSDVTFKSANNNAAFNDMLNKAGYDYNGATGSAVDYFHAQSNNAYNPTFDVVGPVTLSHNLEYYGEQGTINGYEENDMYIADFVIDAVTAAESAGCDFSKYDSNNDGYVDIVYFIYAGKGQANGGTAETIWPHNWELISAIYYKQTHGGSGYYVNINTQGNITSMNIPTFDGKKINNYACSAELRGDGKRSGIGTFCHEFSHVLGLPDYYDADGEDNGENVQTPQEWSIMDYGSYNNNEMTPPNYSIYDKYFMGWATPKFLAKDEKKNVSLTTGYDDAYQITGGSSLVDFTNTGTVYYLENRQKTGWDAALPGHGMLVWQVKYSASVWENNAPNNTAGNARYTIVPADGKTSNYGTSSDPFPGTSKKTSYTPKTGCALTQISESDGVISFKYNGGITGHSVVVNGTGCTISPSVTTVPNGQGFTATIIPTDDTYDFTSISVTRGSTTLTQGTHYTLSSDKKTLTVNASAVTGSESDAFTITAVWTKNRYKYEMLGEHCTPEEAEGTVAKNAALNLTILPASGYTLADASCWDVEMGGATLTYGTGFTYNASNGAFAITEVTGDVAIVAYGGNAITWSANGSVFASTVAFSNMIQLPTSEPEVECNGKVFVGWCADANYESESTAPTFVKNGDVVSEAKTFYAVFATPGTGGTSSIEKATSIAVGDEVILVCESKTMELSSFTTSGTIYGVGSSYSGTPSGDYSFTVVAGSEANSYAFVRDGKYWNWTSGNSLSTATTLSANTSWAVSFSGGNANITNKSNADRKIQWNAGSPRFACYTSGQTAVQLYKKVGGGTSYSDYTTICTAPCVGDLTSITLNTDNVTKVFTEGEAFTYEGLVVTANYDGCESKTVTPTSVSTPDMNQIGAQDVTVTYEGKSATYEITINALPTYTIRFYNNTTLLSSQNVKQGQAATKPSPDPTPCTDYTFVGWYTAALAEDNTDEPTCVTNFTATKDQDYYAVFSKTEEGEGGGSRNSTFDTKDQGYSNGDDGGTKEIDDVTFAFAKGTNTSNSPKYYSSSECIHLYPNNTLTISAESNISSIEFTFSRNDGWTAYPGTWNTTTSSWTGEATSITFTVASTTGSQVRISKIVVTIGSGASSTTYYTTAPTCEECTAAVTITKGTPANGSYTLDKVGEQSTCDGQLVVTVSEIVPASGYRFLEITQTGIEGAVIDQDNKTVTYAKKANGESTINVVFEAIPTYIISFYDNETKISEQEVLEGKSAEKPEDPEPACEAYTFEGWYTAELAANNTVKPTYVTDFTATTDQDYYAIFKKEETGSGESEVASVTFKTASSDDSNERTSDDAIKTNLIESYTGVSGFSGGKAYLGKNGVKLGSSSSAGYITLTLNASASIKKVVVDGSQYGSDTGKLQIEAGSTSLGSKSPAANLEFVSETPIETDEVTVSTTSKRAYVASISVIADGGSITFYTSTVTNENCKWPTEVENIDDEKPAAVKALMNGQIVIIRGEAVYSITGVRIK